MVSVVSVALVALAMVTVMVEESILVLVIVLAIQSGTHSFSSVNRQVALQQQQPLHHTITLTTTTEITAMDQPMEIMAMDQQAKNCVLLLHDEK